ncbi:septum site-determining protein MinC [Thauera humireducens]|uniref:septum site-determining protein MinC n=1 Tax=Thauera humireducens TaxID=1134435 RepID=UPI00311F99F8
MLGGMPDFFNGEAVVLDFSGLREVPATIDWAGLNSLLRRYRLQPIGVFSLPAEHAESARRAGFAELDAAALRERPAAQAPRPLPLPRRRHPRPAKPPRLRRLRPQGIQPTLFVDRPLRSGQQIYARGADLVLIGGVSPGAEVIADGSIHCYGPMRGRAIAGANGDERARIIASNFGPELVSIAGVFRTFERGIPETVAGRAAQVRLTGADHTLNIEPLPLA